jgi:hypothetical protein
MRWCWKLSEEQAVYDLVERCETPRQWEFRDVSSPSVPAGPTTRDTNAPSSLLPFTPRSAGRGDAVVDGVPGTDLGSVTP